MYVMSTMQVMSSMQVVSIIQVMSIMSMMYGHDPNEKHWKWRRKSHL